MSDDPFDVPEKKPAVSWKGAKTGTVITGTVTDEAVEVQSRDFDTGEKATWPDGNPKMAVVVGLLIDGEKYNLWAPKPGSLFAALAKAHKDQGPIKVGGKLKVRLSGQKPNPDKPRLNPQNLFQAKYEPADAFAEDEGASAQAEEAAEAAGAQGEVKELDTPF
jgi:hypothetical protein